MLNLSPKMPQSVKRQAVSGDLQISVTYRLVLDLHGVSVGSYENSAAEAAEDAGK